VEEIQTSTNIPEDTTTSIKSSTSTPTPTPDEFEEVVFPSETETEVTTTTEEATPTSTTEPEPEPKPKRNIVRDTIIGFAGLAGAATVAYLKFKPKLPGNQLADNVFEDNVGMENPLYEGTAGQNENPLYEANVDFDSLDDHIDAFA